MSKHATILELERWLDSQIRECDLADDTALKAFLAEIEKAVDEIPSQECNGAVSMLLRYFREVLEELSHQPAAKRDARLLFQVIGASHGSSEEPVAPTPTAEPNSEPALEISLDDIVGILLTLDSSDQPELTSIQKALYQLSSQTDYSPVDRETLFEAAELIGMLLESGTGSVEEITRLVGSILNPGECDPTPALEEETETGSTSAEDFSTEPETLPADADIELLREFISESLEMIESAEVALLALESDPDNQEAINTVFRSFHTIKGTSAFMGLARLSALAHHAESFLCRVRDGEVRFNQVYADLSLKSIDTLKSMVRSVEQAIEGMPMTIPSNYGILIRELQSPPTTVEGSASPAVKVEEASAGPIEDRSGESSADAWLRVRTDRLDRLVDTIGEMVIAHSIVAQDDTFREGTHRDLNRKIGHAGKIIRELQDLSMGMRMVPLKATFQKMARLVRDLTQRSGKLVIFTTAGEETEIDRNMVDIIKDPLVHMIRNAVDHGIEPPDQRVASGKPESGILKLSAFHAGGNVVVELLDDGRGIDGNRILQKAIEKGIVPAGTTLPKEELLSLIFRPGFSTAERITDVSGRGVGLDVVRQNVEQLRGKIQIDSEPGMGTRFSIQLPLTLAITDGMLVRIGEERYIIPTTNIEMTLRPDEDHLSRVLDSGELLSLRGELIPILRLYELFGIEGANRSAASALLVIVTVAQKRVAIMVDDLLGQHQVVAKSLSESFGKVLGISGAAILGDGRVGLILDTSEMLKLAAEASGPRVRAVA